MTSVFIFSLATEDAEKKSSRENNVPEPRKAATKHVGRNGVRPSQETGVGSEGRAPLGPTIAQNRRARTRSSELAL